MNGRDESGRDLGKHDELAARLRQAAAAAVDQLAALEDEPMDQDLWRRVVHEAGHAVVALQIGVLVSGIVMDHENPTSSKIENWVALKLAEGTEDEDAILLSVAVAGYATVGTCLGPDEEVANLRADLHNEATSDLNRAHNHARSIVGEDATEGAVIARIREADLAVRELLRHERTQAAIVAVANHLYDQRQIDGGSLRLMVERANEAVDAGSGAPAHHPAQGPTE